VVTNNHVVSGTREVAIRFATGEVVGASIVGTAPNYEIAVLRLNSPRAPLHPIAVGSSADLQVGQAAFAIGNPFGEQQSLSVGVVSATERSVESLTQFQISGAIQTDASINPGNSGGPLLDAGARVIGINQQIETNSGANDGVGFAVPINSVKRSLAQLREDGGAEYAYIGVSSQPLYPQLARKLGLEASFGGLLSEVIAGGPAEDAGLRGGDEKLRFQAVQYRVGGDVILDVDGQQIVGPDDLAKVIAARQPGDTVALTILRDGERKEIELTLGERPDDPSN